MVCYSNCVDNKCVSYLNFECKSFTIHCLMFDGETRCQTQKVNNVFMWHENQYSISCYNGRCQITLMPCYYHYWCIIGGLLICLGLGFVAPLIILY